MRGGSRKGSTVPANRTPTKRAIFIMEAKIRNHEG